MNPKDGRRKRSGGRAAGWMIVGLAVLIAGGCAAPASVSPLLSVVERALQEEAALLQQEAQRDAQWIEQTQASLAQAYEADLTQQQELTAEWVRQATEGYVLAREALLRHRLALEQERERRVDNLEAAAWAARRAQSLMQQRDQLLAETIGTRLWRLLAEPGSSASPAPR